MPPSKKKATSTTQQSSAKPNPELPRKINAKKAELRKKELTEALAHTPRTILNISPIPSEELARKETLKKAEQKKQELTEALTYPSQAAHNFSSNSVENQEKDYFYALGAKIARRAYELHERRGKVHGHDLEDWLEAERQIFSGENS